jgi:hypothetical protein
MPAAIIGYIRVSTDKQAKAGSALASAGPLRASAAAEILEVAGEFIEVLSSRRCGAKPYREIAEGLTSRNIPTPRGGDAWNAMSVMRAMKRLRIAGK